MSTFLKPLALVIGLALAACGEPAAPPPPGQARLAPVAFDALTGWADDRQSEALAALGRSCTALAKRPADAAMGPVDAGTVAAWQPACAALADVPPGDQAARQFFETWFTPVAVTVGGDAQGLFTGYYEPLLQGARTPDNRFRYPLYGRPPDLVAVDLGPFDPALQGRRIAGRLQGGKLVPYPDRAAIEGGALQGRGLELFWVDDPIALFFLQIQGSGQLALAGGQRLRVGYADQNGRPYRAIGRDLVELGELEQASVSLQSIRDWLRAHPDRAAGIMARNPSYVFFRELGPVDPSRGPPGGQGVPLTPGRSIAVDRSHVAYGTPVWLDTTAPYPQGERPWQRLMVAQDTGGAIRGAIRGDVFWGAGELAEYVAGHMRSAGRWYLLLPRGVALSG